MGRALVIALAAAVVIGGLALVLIVIKLTRENARQREAASRPEVWPPVTAEQQPARPARRPAALMNRDYPPAEAQSAPQRVPGAEPRAGQQFGPGPQPGQQSGPSSGPMRVARSEPPSGPMSGPMSGPISGPQPIYAEPASGPHPTYTEPQSGPQPMPEQPSGPQPVQQRQKMQTPPPGWRPPVRSTRPYSSNGESSDD